MGTDHICAEIAKILDTPPQSPADTIAAIRDLKRLCDGYHDILYRAFFAEHPTSEGKRNTR